MTPKKPTLSCVIDAPEGVRVHPIDRKILAEMAISDPAGFAQVAKMAG